MRFETSKTVPPHLNRKLQLRMLSFVGMFAVILLCMSLYQARNGKNKKDKPLPGAPDPSAYKVLESDRTTLGDGEFFSPPDDPNLDPKHRERPWQEPPPLGADAIATPDGLDQEIARRQTQFDKGILRKVKDNTIGIRRDETEAYYRLLNHARRASTTELEKSGATDVLYINLMDQPEQFRGEAVTIHGDLWRLYEFQAGPNEFGLKTLYEGWVFTPDSDNHPYRIVFTNLPRELEPGENLRKPVRVTGYFFKREGYASSGGMHVAPTLLAQRIVPYRPPGAPPPTDAIVPYMIGLVSAVGLAFLVTLVSFTISDRRAARVALQRELNTPTPSFAGIQDSSTLTVGESLHQLEEAAWQAHGSDAGHATAEPVTDSQDSVPASTHRTGPRPGPTDEELAERRREEARAVKSWTAQQNSKNGAADTSNGPKTQREKQDASRVLNQLDSPSTGSSERLENASEEAESPSPEPDGSDQEVTGQGARSKLAAWESEIEELGQGRNRRAEDQRAARADLDRDEAARERELNDRLRQQRAEVQSEQEARDAQDESAGDASNSANQGNADSKAEDDSDDNASSGWFRRSGRRRRRDGHS
jgi:hypothetical protein